MDSMASVSSVGVPPAALMESAYRGPCRILGAHITRIARGGSEVVICEEYCDGLCRLRQAAFERAADQPASEVVAPAIARCIMLSA